MTSYWSYTEVLSRDELGYLQGRRLKTLLKYLCQRSSYHRKKLEAHGCLPKDVKGIEDIKRLPFTTKEDLIKDINEEESVVFYRNFFVDRPENILRWNKTSGTTGTAVRIADTLWDWNAYAELSAEALYAMGVRRGDTAIVPFGYGPFIAFWLYIAGLEKIGTAFVPSGGLDASGRIALIKEFKATVLICTSSYALHLGEIAQTMGVNFGKDTNIRLVIVTGEPPLPNARTLIKEIWKAEKRDRLGCAEAGGIAFECPFCPGIYHIQERYVIPEVKVEFNSSWMGF